MNNLQAKLSEFKEKAITAIESERYIIENGYDPDVVFSNYVNYIFTGDGWLDWDLPRAFYANANRYRQYQNLL